MILDSLEAVRDRQAEHLREVERLMTRALGSSEPVLQEVGRYLLESGGKRLRPLLCLLAAEACSVAREKAQLLAAAAELTHAASLCHDDVLDGGELRRGRATVRSRFGDATSILLGDVCLGQAFGLLAEQGLGAAGASLGRVVLAMAEGEVRQASRWSWPDATVEDYLEIAEAKTGALLRWCGTLGGLVPTPLLCPMDRYARSLGRAYQIADDLLDVDPSAPSGKSVWRDLCSGRPNLPILVAAGEDDALGRQLRRGLAAGKAEAMAGLVAELGFPEVINRARRRALAEVASAVAALRELPETEARTALETLARFAAQRDS